MIENNSLKFVYIKKIKPVAGWHNNYIVHPYHELIVVLSGIMHVSGGSQKFELHPGDAALYPAGVEHREYADASEPVESCFLVFEDHSLTGNRILVNRKQGILLRAMASSLYEISASGEPVAFGTEYLGLMLKIFSTKSPAAGTTSDMIRKVHSFIRQNMASPITLTDLANVAGLSKYHFLRQYRHECGKTPVQAMWEVRCSEAVSLLKYTNLSIKEIALRTGFSNMAHFFHRIKAFSGKGPSELRD